MIGQDHDDGSNNFVDTSNVVAFAGMKNFLGFAKQTSGNLFIRPDIAGASWTPRGAKPGLQGVPLPRAYYFPYCARSVGQKQWHALADTFTNNTCILNTSGSVYEFQSCDPAAPGASGELPRAHGNTFFVPGSQSNTSFKCGSTMLTIAAAQAVGYENGSTCKNSTAMAPTDIQEMIRAWLRF